jgi:DNA helicase HerA-like ATPase
VSSDDYLRIRKHPLGGFTYIREYNSGNGDTREAHEIDPQFSTIENAMKAALREGAEYGVYLDSECEDL